jgi:hypothetical protein
MDRAPVTVFATIYYARLSSTSNPPARVAVTCRILSPALIAAAAPALLAKAAETSFDSVHNSNNRKGK